MLTAKEPPEHLDFGCEVMIALASDLGADEPVSQLPTGVFSHARTTFLLLEGCLRRKG